MTRIHAILGEDFILMQVDVLEDVHKLLIRIRRISGWQDDYLHAIGDFRLFFHVERRWKFTVLLLRTQSVESVVQKSCVTLSL